MVRFIIQDKDSSFMNNIPKVLIVENECLSYSSSNGRTLANLFLGWSRDHLAQFCISMNDPNYEVCDNYYCVTDYDALYALIRFKKIDGKHEAIKPSENSSRKSIKKTPFTMVIRNAIWNTNAWLQKSFYDWVENFHPDLILLMNGDSYFMHKIACDLAEKYNLPMVIFNCEAYYFFDKNISGKGFMPGLFQKIYVKHYRKMFEKAINYADYSIYQNEVLERDYTDVFHKPASTIYTSSELTFEPKYEISDRPKFSYLGTFFFDRYKSLIEIALALKEINPEYHLDVYGNLNGYDESKIAFEECDAIKYCGVVTYDKVVNVIRESDIVFHAECFDEEKVYAIRYGFSTKIADNLSSGNNFLAFAPENIAFMQYLRSNDCAWCVTKIEDLLPTLKRLLTDKDEKIRILSNAKSASEKNHRADKNSKRFQKILIKCYQKHINKKLELIT